MHMSHAGLDLTGRRLDFCLLDGERAQERLERGALGGDGRREEPLGIGYSGHEVSRWALSTVSSRSSSAACASKSVSGTVRALVHAERVQAPVAVRDDARVRRRLLAGGGERDEVDDARRGVRVDAQRQALAAGERDDPGAAVRGDRLREADRPDGQALGVGDEGEGARGRGAWISMVAVWVRMTQVGLRTRAACDRGERTGRVNSRVGTTRCASAAVVTFNHDVI